MTDSAAPTAQAVLHHIVTSIVDHPDQVRVDVTSGSSGAVLEVRVADGDMGRVIGKRGRVAQAIRTLVRAAATKDQVDVDIEFID